MDLVYEEPSTSMPCRQVGQATLGIARMARAVAGGAFGGSATTSKQIVRLGWPSAVGLCVGVVLMFRTGLLAASCCRAYGSRSHGPGHETCLKAHLSCCCHRNRRLLRVRLPARRQNCLRRTLHRPRRVRRATSAGSRRPSAVTDEIGDGLNTAVRKPICLGT